MEENIHNNNNEVDEKLMDHDYDGIKELDNPPPSWIMAIFYISIAFSLIYAAYYFWLDVGDHQDAEYVKRVEKHDQKYNMNKPAGEDMFLLSDAVAMEEGKDIFNVMNCAACHGLSGEGNAIGPNLTDDFWINGCSFDEVFSTIKNGKPAKGMTAFKGQISDEKIQKVASYILVSIKGTNPENAKEPQGLKCE